MFTPRRAKPIFHFRVKQIFGAKSCSNLGRVVFMYIFQIFILKFRLLDYYHRKVNIWVGLGVVEQLKIRMLGI